MVQNIEELSSQLNREALMKYPHLGHREVPVVITRAAEDVALHGAEGSRRGWRHDAAAVDIAAEAGEGCLRSLISRRSQAPRRSGIGSDYRSRICSRVKRKIRRVHERDSGWQRFEIERISCEIPTVAEFSRQADVIPVQVSVHHVPRQTALQGHD